MANNLPNINLNNMDLQSQLQPKIDELSSIASQLGGSTPNVGTADNNQSTTTPQTYFDYLSQNPSEIQAPVSKMDITDPSIAVNAVRDVQRNVTGLTNAWVHKDEVGKAFWDYYTDPDNTAGKAWHDVINAFLSTYNTKLEDFGTLPAKDIVANVLEGVHRNPASFALDLISFGGASAITKMFPQLKKGAEVEKGIATITAEAAPDFEKLYTGFTNLIKDAKKAKVNPAEILKAAEEGTELGSKEAKELFKRTREFSFEQDRLAKKYNPSSYLGHEETAITQNILRRRLNSGITDATFAQVEREITPMLDLIKADKLSEVQKLAKEGNAIAREVAGAKALYDKGRIFPISHGLAKVDKIGEEIARKVGEVAGTFSRRAFGTSSYQDIAKQWAKPQEFLEQTIKRYGEGAIAQNLAKGDLGGRIIDSTINKNTRYLNRELLQNGKLRDALADATAQRRTLNDVPLDKYTLNALKAQLDTPNSAWNGLMKELYQTNKSALLASGTYIGPNLITGAGNAIINSNLGLINDIVSAIRSRGRLAKELGVYRRRTLPRPSQMPGLRQVQQFNRLVGGQLFSNIDRALQNTFAEIAAHSELRKSGIRFADRANLASKLDRAKLGDILTDIKRTALINSPNVPLPSAIRDTAFAYSPFWRWQVTAAQSTIKMLEKNPLLSNVVLQDIIANIGFDKEMQNRLNLNVSLDKPYVSYKIDNKTGKIKEVSAEFIPMTTPMKALAQALGDKDAGLTSSQPVLTAIYNASQGKDKYGRPLKYPESIDGTIRQTIGGVRMKYDPQLGFVKDEGSRIDTVNAAVKELLALPNLMNRTAAPMVAPLIGEEGFYQPYNASLFGSYTQTPQGNRFIGGNPNSIRTPEDVIKAFSGEYQRDYEPSTIRDEYLTPNQIRRFMNTRNRRMGRVEWQ